ncbi:MAG: hypothetical protein ACYC99_05710 [Candidatus Geothermincolia bacterium]
MRRSICILLASLLLTGLVGFALAGCDTTTVKLGDTEVQTKDGKTTVKTGEGETTVTTRTPTEAEAGVPIYPNAKMDENAALTTKNAAGQEEFIAASLWTDDSTDKVIAWYKEKLAGKPELTEMPVTEGGVNEMIFGWRDGDKYKMVTVGADKGDHPGKTSIAIGAGSAPQQ